MLAPSAPLTKTLPRSAKFFQRLPLRVIRVVMSTRSPVQPRTLSVAF